MGLGQLGRSRVFFREIMETLIAFCAPARKGLLGEGSRGRREEYLARGSRQGACEATSKAQSVKNFENTFSLGSPLLEALYIPGEAQVEQPRIPWKGGSPSLSKDRESSSVLGRLS